MEQRSFLTVAASYTCASDGALLCKQLSGRATVWLSFAVGGWETYRVGMQIVLQGYCQLQSKQSNIGRCILYTRCLLVIGAMIVLTAEGRESGIRQFSCPCRISRPLVTGSSEPTRSRSAVRGAEDLWTDLSVLWKTYNRPSFDEYLDSCGGLHWDFILVFTRLQCVFVWEYPLFHPCASSVACVHFIWPRQLQPAIIYNTSC